LGQSTAQPRPPDQGAKRPSAIGILPDSIDPNALDSVAHSFFICLARQIQYFGDSVPDASYFPTERGFFIVGVPVLNQETIND
jgi:hypothetical protein